VKSEDRQGWMKMSLKRGPWCTAVPSRGSSGPYGDCEWMFHHQ